MSRLSGWYRLLVFIAVIWGIIICCFAWQIYIQKKNEIYSQWYSVLYRSLNDSSFSWTENPDLTTPQLIEVMEKELNNNKNQCANFDILPSDKQFCDLVPNIEMLRTKFQNDLDNIISSSFIRTAFLAWALPILFIYLMALSIIWIYRGFSQ